MTIPFAAVLFAALVGSPGDTLLQVQRGDRLVLPGAEGVLEVRTWNRSEVEIRAEGEGSGNVLLTRSGSRVELSVRDRRGRTWDEDLSITLPPWMGLEMTGQEFEATITGLAGGVTVRNLEGDLTLRDLAGEVDVYSVEGELEATGLSGSARLRAGDDGIRVVNSTAVLELETVDGDIRMEDVSGPRISARSTSGDIDFLGRIPRGAAYDFRSHSGDIELRLNPPVSVDVSVLAYAGDFESDFPARARGFTSGESFTFTLGQGGAHLSLETFSGELSLVDPTRLPAPDGPRYSESPNRSMQSRFNRSNPWRKP